MKCNQWTLALLGVGLIGVPAAMQAEEKPSSLLTAVSSTTLSGYVSTDMTWRPGTGNSDIPGRGFDHSASKQDGFNLDVVSLTLSKPVGEGDWGAGYLAQIWAGPDAVGFNTAFPNTSASGGDFAVRQAYVDLHAPLGTGLDIKIGHFNYIGGYESADAGDNPNFSRSFAWTLEPVSHTGVLLSYKCCEWFSIAGGAANTYNNGINWRPVELYNTGGATTPETEKTYMGQIAFTAPKNWGFLSGATLTSTIVNGLNNASGNGGVPTSGHITTVQTSANIPTPIAGFSVGASYDYVDGAPIGAGNEGKYANAGTLYLLYAKDKWKFCARTEYASGSSGFWYTQAPTSTIHGAELLGVTGTVDYSLWANVMSRLEVRWDHSLTGDKPYTAGSPLIPQFNVVTIALNVIYKF